MAAWTESDLAEVKRLIRSGVQSAAHRDKRFTNRSLAELKEIKRMIEAELAGSTRRPPAGFARHRKGLH